MMAVILFGIVFACALLLLLAMFGKNPVVARAEREHRDRPAGRVAIGPARLRGLVVELLEAMGLSIAEDPPPSPEGAASQRLVAIRSDPFRDIRYVVFIEAAPPGEVIEQPMLLELAEQLKSEPGAQGLLFTPYAIERAGTAGLEENIHLIDGFRLRELCAKHLPYRLPELDRYQLGGERGERAALPVEAGPPPARPVMLEPPAAPRRAP